jgi:hypothetical protein
MASLGHVASQAPQSMQTSALIEYTSPSEMASTGHSPIQEPQATHFSASITRAIMVEIVVISSCLMLHPVGVPKHVAGSIIEGKGNPFRRTFQEFWQKTAFCRTK